MGLLATNKTMEYIKYFIVHSRPSSHDPPYTISFGKDCRVRGFLKFFESFRKDWKTGKVSLVLAHLLHSIELKRMRKTWNCFRKRLLHCLATACEIFFIKYLLCYLLSCRCLKVQECKTILYIIMYLYKQMIDCNQFKTNLLRETESVYYNEQWIESKNFLFLQLCYKF